ncbi:MAG: metallophosphoesterase [Spirochaetales bacterium]|nr:MAG: metallophosphoesterase [Spirochaetales bacterium]
MKLHEFLATMRTLVDEARTEKLTAESRIVFLSDLHLGNRFRGDDFRKNEDLVKGALSSFYLSHGWKLVLNGDVEELHKFKYHAIREAYPELYSIFGSFRDGGRLVKLVGNHDLALLAHEDGEFPLEQALRLDAETGTILAFHGHQSHRFFMKYNFVSDFIIHYIANPLRIPSVGKPVTSRRRYNAERRIYRVSKELGVVTIAGHTHRPLFESCSKYDSLRWNIESALRQYTLAVGGERERIESMIGIYVQEFNRLSRKERRRKLSRNLYERDDIRVPCLFNSGCAISRGGFTAIEIEGPDISLVYWTREGNARPYIEREALFRDRPEGTPWQRYTIARDSLEYVFARLKLLA